MSQSIWRVVALVEAIVMLSFVVVSYVLGGCSGMIETASGGQVPMKCHWTFTAIPLVAVVGAIVAAAGAFSSEKQTRRVAAFVTLLLTVAILLIMSSFGIGLCGKAEMSCHTTEKFIIAFGVISIVISLIQLVKADPAKADLPKARL